MSDDRDAASSPRTRTPLAPLCPLIMIMRHAEKPAESGPPYGVTPNGVRDDDSLSVRGWQRAGALVAFFASPPRESKLGTPSVIYAARATRREPSIRTAATVLALAERLGTAVTLRKSFAKGQELALAKSAMRRRGAVLICWDHRHIPALARALRLSARATEKLPAEWNEERFDLIWRFRRKKDGTYRFRCVPQRLLAGDDA